ncbi:MAG: 6-phosphogluconolactonase [Desulfovibrio sp.]|nr:6-phosphogluconolactonase [Desulfovibrio sp.]
MMKSRSVHLSLHIHKNPEAMAERAAHILAAACEEAVAERGVFKIALSGGTSPIPLFRLLARTDWADRLPWDKMTFFWVDERGVGPDHPDSNYGLARRELLSKVPATHFYRIHGEDDPEEAAARYEEQIRRDFNLGPNETPRFDFMLLGMGDDGHTGSIFPNSPALAEKKRIAMDVYVPERKTDRITLTLPVINNSRCCMFLVNGEDKRETLTQAMNLLTPPKLPSQMVRPRAGDLVWIVDEAAATGARPGKEKE